MDQEFAKILQYEIKQYIDLNLQNKNIVPSSSIKPDMLVTIDDIQFIFEFYLIDTFSSFNIKKKPGQTININIKVGDNVKKDEYEYEDSMNVINKLLKIGEINLVTKYCIFDTIIELLLFLKMENVAIKLISSMMYLILYSYDEQFFNDWEYIKSLQNNQCINSGPIINSLLIMKNNIQRILSEIIFLEEEMEFDMFYRMDPNSINYFTMLKDIDQEYYNIITNFIKRNIQ